MQQDVMRFLAAKVVVEVEKYCGIMWVEFFGNHFRMIDGFIYCGQWILVRRILWFYIFRDKCWPHAHKNKFRYTIWKTKQTHTQ